jgi:hypothetical protein
MGAVSLVSRNGSVWTAAGPLPTGLTGATSISCTDDQHCWVAARTLVDVDHVAGALALTSDAGVAWTRVDLPAGIGFLNGVSCLSTSSSPQPGAAGVNATDCVVVGSTDGTLGATRAGAGIVLTSPDGGGSWSKAPVSGFVASLADVSCVAVGSCVTVGNSVAGMPQAGIVVLTGHDNGKPDSTWKAAATVGSPQSLSSVSCTSMSACVLVGESTSLHLAGG